MPQPKKLPAIHPGEILREEFLQPLDLSLRALARALHVPVSQISAVVHEKRPITAPLALGLARYFNMTAEFWIGLQKDFELRQARDTASRQIEREVLPRAS